jgi:hypothetical protein
MNARDIGDNFGARVRHSGAGRNPTLPFFIPEFAAGKSKFLDSGFRRSDGISLDVQGMFRGYSGDVQARQTAAFYFARGF